MQFGIKTVVVAVVLSVALVSWSAESELFPNIRKARKEAQKSDPSSVVVDEEMIVTAPKPKRGHVPQFEYLLETYKARSKGSLLYRQGKYAEAFPYLLVAAKRGFKLAQARVGFLFQQGLGTERDGEAAIAWLALSSTPDTLPEIRNYFRQQWAKIPPEYLPYLEEVIEEYREEFGDRENRVVCDMSRKAGTHFGKLTCRFMDESFYQDFSEAINSDEAMPQIGGGGASGSQSQGGGYPGSGGAGQ